MSRLLMLVLAVALALPAGLAAARDDDARRKPPTKVTEKLSAAVFEKIKAAQEAMDAKDLAGAEALLNELVARADKLNDYEQAQTYNFLAAIHYEQGRTDDTIADYFAILKLAKAPQQLRINALFRLAQLYFVKEDYARSVQLLDEWMKQVDNVRPEAHMLKAQAFYQLERYAEAKPPIIDALKEAQRRGQAPRESWMGLLRAVYYQLEDYPNAVRVLGKMVEHWPKPSYYTQLSGMLGLMGQQQAQLHVLRAAAVSGMLESEFEILNLARLYMAEDVPNPAVELLQQAMADGRVEETAENLQLLAQAMSLAKDFEAQIPVLTKAAKLSGDAQQFMYLGQAQIALYRWADAARSLQTALEIGGLDRPGAVHMQVGTAYYNLKQYNRALRAFKAAAEYDDYAEQARQWVRFVGQEVQRAQAMRGS